MKLSNYMPNASSVQQKITLIIFQYSPSYSSTHRRPQPFSIKLVLPTHFAHSRQYFSNSMCLLLYTIQRNIYFTIDLNNNNNFTYEITYVVFLFHVDVIWLLIFHPFCRLPFIIPFTNNDTSFSFSQWTCVEFGTAF